MAGIAIVLDLLRKNPSWSGQTLHSYALFSASLAASTAAASVAASTPFASRALFGNFGRSIAYCEAGVASTDEDYISSIRNVSGNIFQLDSLQYSTKEYRIELKPIFSAFGLKPLAMTSLRSFLLFYLPLLEPRSNVEEDDDDFPQDTPEEHRVDLVVPFKKSVKQIVREIHLPKMVEPSVNTVIFLRPLGLFFSLSQFQLHSGGRQFLLLLFFSTKCILSFVLVGLLMRLCSPKFLTIPSFVCLGLPVLFFFPAKIGPNLVPGLSSVSFWVIVLLRKVIGVTTLFPVVFMSLVMFLFSNVCLTFSFLLSLLQFPKRIWFTLTHFLLRYRLMSTSPQFLLSLFHLLLLLHLWLFLLLQFLLLLRC